MSMEAAIEYVNLTDITVEEELEKIKKDLDYRTKMLDFLERLKNVDTEGKLDKSIQDEIDKLIEEFSLDEEE